MALTNPFLFLSDAIYRAPTIGSMLMCLTAGLVGTLVFLRKQSLIGEALSHASYPGVILGVMVAALFFQTDPDSLLLAGLILFGAFVTALLGLSLVQFLTKKMKVSSDAALCFTLSSFFGVGVTLASQAQFSFTSFYKQISVYLYGQAATMTDLHIYLYGALALLTISLMFAFYKELQAIAFDRAYAVSLGIPVQKIDLLFCIVMVLSIIVGIRFVGVVLMSAMLIAPPVAARQFTNKLSTLFFLSAFFGVFSGFFGNYFSTELTEHLAATYPTIRLAIPTGPMIVLVSITIFLLALFIAPERGLLVRFVRITRFRYQCVCENLLKTFWRKTSQQPLTFAQIAGRQDFSHFYLRFLLFRMVSKGWIEKAHPHRYQLTKDGLHLAAKIVRLHRLWELYLTNYLGVGSERVHRIAEEMEHIITPEIEKKLTLLLNNPTEDPHQQPIPPQAGRYEYD